MKGLYLLALAFIVAASTSCTLPEPDQGVPADTSNSSTDIAISHAIREPTERSVPDLTPPLRPYPPPAPSPCPAPTGEQHLPVPTVAIHSVEDCALHPNFSRCRGNRLTGKLTYFDPDDQLVVLDLDTETAWRSTQPDLLDAVWASTGEMLLVHDESYNR